MCANDTSGTLGVESTLWPPVQHSRHLREKERERERESWRRRQLPVKKLAINFVILSSLRIHVKINEYLLKIKITKISNFRKSPNFKNFHFKIFEFQTLFYLNNFRISEIDKFQKFLIFRIVLTSKMFKLQNFLIFRNVWISKIKILKTSTFRKFLNFRNNFYISEFFKFQQYLKLSNQTFPNFSNFQISKF